MKDLFRDVFLGFVRIHILHHANKEPIYGLEMLEELWRHGYDLSPGTIYPILHTLAQNGYLDVEKRLIEGKIRKYYTITDLGKAALAETLPKIQELVHEVLEKSNEHIKNNPT